MCTSATYRAFSHSLTWASTFRLVRDVLRHLIFGGMTRARILGISGILALSLCSGAEGVHMATHSESEHVATAVMTGVRVVSPSSSIEATSCRRSWKRKSRHPSHPRRPRRRGSGGSRAARRGGHDKGAGPEPGRDERRPRDLVPKVTCKAAVSPSRHLSASAPGTGRSGTARGCRTPCALLPFSNCHPLLVLVACAYRVRVASPDGDHPRAGRPELVKRSQYR